MAVDPFVAESRDTKPSLGTPMPPAKAWWATRPGDLDEPQPQGGPYGYQGPDQGYALHLASRIRDRVVLARGEQWAEVAYGAMGLASRRASTRGRAPINDDISIAFLVWGFLPEEIPDDVIEALIALRGPLFAGVIHDVADQRRITEGVADGILDLTPLEIHARMKAGEVLVAGS